MKEKDRAQLWRTVRVVMAVVGSVCAVYGLYANQALCTAAGLVTVLLVYYFSSRSSQLREAWFNHAMTTVVRNIERANNYAVQRLPIGIGVFDHDGHLQWRNRLFNEILSVDAPLGASFEKIMPPPENNLAALGVRDADKQLKVGDRVYSMLVRRVKTMEEQEEDTGVVIYLIDITDKERQQRRYDDERPVVAYVQFDNYADAQKGLNESDRANMVVGVTKAISAWAEEIHGYSIKYSEDLYLVGINKKGLLDTIGRKFPVLDEVRKIRINPRTTPTISIGIACGGKNLAQMSQKAQSCLDLALGRGGDQAVVSMGEEISFYGARGSVQAKNTRVRARIVAQAIHELMTNADKVFIMGHVNEDYDAIGAAIGVAKMARTLGKECYIVSSGQGTAMTNLAAMTRNQKNEYLDLVIDEDTALEQRTPGSLLVLVDHHRPMLTAAPKVLAAIKRRVIIDHHRRAEDAIEDVMLQYMEPSTSSTSEMVTEILQYFQERLEVTPLEASVLYAGILVDTKNFAVQTGERTFEAAAFLRRSGADPHVVSQLFKEDEVSVVRRARIITEMKKPLPGLAISIHHCSVKDRDESVIVAQAADELLTMNDVHVSAVMSENEEGVSISARSDGTVNVQVMMEELGGGGHQTVAGVQIKGAHAEDLVPKIIEMAKAQMMKEENTDESHSAAGREEIG